MNVEVVRDGWNGFLVDKNEDWYTYIEKLIVNDSLKNELGYNGRRFVEEKYSIKTVIENYITLIKNN